MGDLCNIFIIQENFRWFFQLLSSIFRCVSHPDLTPLLFLSFSALLASFWFGYFDLFYW